MDTPPIVTDEPLQIAVALPGVGVGNALVEIFTESVLEHPVEVIVSVTL